VPAKALSCSQFSSVRDVSGDIQQKGRMTDPIERAKDHAAMMYPDAELATCSVRGRPVVLAVEGNLLRIVRLTDLDLPRAAEQSNSTT